MATGHYFQSVEKWTLDRDEAYDFGVISKAVKAAHKLRIRDLELVLSFDGQDALPAAPFARFLHRLSQKQKNQIEGRLASRQAVAA